MMGRNDRTLPTPGRMPSTTIERTTGLVPNDVRPASTAAMIASTSCSITPCSAAPTTPKVSQNTSPMMRRNIGMAVWRPVRTRSIA